MFAEVLAIVMKLGPELAIGAKFIEEIIAAIEAKNAQAGLNALATFEAAFTAAKAARTVT